MTEAPVRIWANPERRTCAPVGQGVWASDTLYVRADIVEELRAALTALRNLVKEGGVPRYTVTPGAALNHVIEEQVDPILSRLAEVSNG